MAFIIQLKNSHLLPRIKLVQLIIIVNQKMSQFKDRHQSRDRIKKIENLSYRNIRHLVNSKNTDLSK